MKDNRNDSINGQIAVANTTNTAGITSIYLSVLSFMSPNQLISAHPMKYRMGSFYRDIPSLRSARTGLVDPACPAQNAVGLLCGLRHQLTRITTRGGFSDGG